MSDNKKIQEELLRQMRGTDNVNMQSKMNTPLRDAVKNGNNVTPTVMQAENTFKSQFKGDMPPQPGTTQDEQTSGNYQDTSDTDVKKSKKGLIALIAALIIIFVIIILIMVLSKNNVFANLFKKDFNEDEWLIEEGEYVFAYTDDEKEELRIRGYTGTEIEEYEKGAESAQILIEQADAKQREYVNEFILPLYDTASDEYKENLKITWLGLPERNDMADFELSDIYYESIGNFDYDKIPVQGNQLFLKINITETDYFFMIISPARWLELPEDGNIVVRYSYLKKTIIGEDGTFYEDDNSIFITDAEEYVIN